jgi:hypothetical protein
VRKCSLFLVGLFGVVLFFSSCDSGDKTKKPILGGSPQQRGSTPIDDVQADDLQADDLQVEPTKVTKAPENSGGSAAVEPPKVQAGPPTNAPENSGGPAATGFENGVLSGWGRTFSWWKATDDAHRGVLIDSIDKPEYYGNVVYKGKTYQVTHESFASGALKTLKVGDDVKFKVVKDVKGRIVSLKDIQRV